MPHPKRASAQSIVIHEAELPVVEFEGQRVVTLAMIDKVHQRPEGTARRNFNANRERLAIGKHFEKISVNVFRTRYPGLISDRATEDITVLTERGYLMLVKSFNDDLAWEVQDQLVEGYFRSKSSADAYSSITASIPTSQTDTVSAIMTVGKFVSDTPGVKIGIAVAAALDCVTQMTGIPTEQFRRLLPATTEPICSHNATQLGKLVGKSAQAINQELLVCGLQRKNARDEWELTEEGEKWGEAMPFARRGHSGYQILWNPEVASQVLKAAA
jgi:hypothetical protein